MSKFICILTILYFAVLCSTAQEDSAFISKNAIRIDDPEKLNNNIYDVLKKYKVVMLGEMHGTNESAQFVKGLANMFSDDGDSVQVGLEIPENLMMAFFYEGTDSSIYQSDFFQNPVTLSGRESVAWANLIATVNKNPKCELFFFDRNDDEGNVTNRDSLMYVKIKMQYLLHPDWKMITLSGNFHNRITDRTTMAFYLRMDRELNLFSRICSLNMEYLEGTCNANFGHGLEIKRLGHDPTIYDTAVSYVKYLLLFPPKSTYQYSGFYYTKTISAAKMVNNK